MKAFNENNGTPLTLFKAIFILNTTLILNKKRSNCSLLLKYRGVFKIKNNFSFMCLPKIRYKDQTAMHKDRHAILCMSIVANSQQKVLWELAVKSFRKAARLLCHFVSSLLTDGIVI